MDAFAIPFALFIGLLAWLLVELIRGSIDDPVALRAGLTWAITCPVAGLLFGIGLAPVAFVVGFVSMLALGSLGFWFLGTEPGDSDEPPEEPVAPDPSPSDDIGPEPELVVVAEVASEPDAGLDWDEFERAREEWEKETPAPAPERLPTGI
jgi:hypothetical protein